MGSTRPPALLGGRVGPVSQPQAWSGDPRARRGVCRDRSVRAREPPRPGGVMRALHMDTGQAAVSGKEEGRPWSPGCGARGVLRSGFGKHVSGGSSSGLRNRTLLPGLGREGLPGGIFATRSLSLTRSTAASGFSSGRQRDLDKVTVACHSPGALRA